MNERERETEREAGWEGRSARAKECRGSRVFEWVRERGSASVDACVWQLGERGGGKGIPACTGKVCIWIALV